MRGGRQSFAERVAKNLNRDIQEINLIAKAVPLTTTFQQTVWVIEVETPKGTLVFSPYQLDNGAEGIVENHLVQLRKTTGENITMPKRRIRTDPYATFTDIISVDPVDNDE